MYCFLWLTGRAWGQLPEDAGWQCEASGGAEPWETACRDVTEGSTGFPEGGSQLSPLNVYILLIHGSSVVFNLQIWLEKIWNCPANTEICSNPLWVTLNVWICTRGGSRISVNGGGALKPSYFSTLICRPNKVTKNNPQVFWVPIFSLPKIYIDR